MGVLVLTDNPRNRAALCSALGEDITVRDIPLPLYRLGAGIVTMSAAGYPKLSPVSKHIAELRKLAARYTVVFIVLPPVPFWYDIAWSVKKALVGIPLQILYFFPSDLAYGLDVDPLLEPPATRNSLLYACDTVLERDLSILGNAYLLSVPKPLYRRSVVCVLGVLARCYESVSAEASVNFQVSALGFKPEPCLLNSESPLAISSVTVSSLSSKIANEIVNPAHLLKSDSIISEIINDMSICILDISKALDALYAYGCLSCYDIDAPVPDGVHTWAAGKLLSTYDLSINLIGNGPSEPCIYVTGKDLPTGQSDVIVALYAYLTRRTLQYYCNAVLKDVEITSVSVEIEGATKTFDVTSMDASVDDWLLISDAPSILTKRAPSSVGDLVPVSIKYMPHFEERFDTIFTYLHSFGIPAREVLTALYYMDKCGLAFVNNTISLSTFGYLYYSLLSKSSMCFDKSLDLFSVHVLVNSSLDTEEILSRVSAIFQGAIPADLTDLFPGTSSGINIDLTTMLLRSDTDTYGVALCDRKLMPIKLGVLVNYLCPICGANKAITVLGSTFSTVYQCANPKCSSLQPISLVPNVSMEENDAT